jgi:hypothetical protein
MELYIIIGKMKLKHHSFCGLGHDERRLSVIMLIITHGSGIFE